MALNRRFQRKQVAAGSPSGGAATVQLVSSDATKLPPAGDGGTDDAFYRRQVRVMQRLSEFLQHQSLPLVKVIEGMLDIVCRSLDAQAGSLWLLEEATGELVCKVAEGPTAKRVRDARVAIGKGIVGWVAEKGRSTIVYDAEKDERFTGTTDQSTGFTTKTLITSPLCYGGGVIGAIQIVNRKGDGGFTDADLRFLDALCTPVAMHIHNSRLIRSQEDTLAHLEGLKSLNAVFGATLELKALLALVLERTLELLEAEVGSLWLVEARGEGLECEVAEGPTKDKVIGLKIKRGSGFVGWVVEHRQPVCVEDCANDPRFSAAMDKKLGFVTRSMLCAPLLAKDEVIGAIQIINKRDRNLLFTQRDLDLLTMCASAASMHIKNARLFEAERKNKELTALMEISKEITSTLDLDAVLMSVVNLSSQVIPYDRASIAIEARGRTGLEVRAISGADKVDRAAPETVALGKLHEALAATEGETRIEDVALFLEKGPKDLPEALAAALNARPSGSFLAVPLKDDQGTLGMFVLEADAPGAFSLQATELLPILISQMTVSIRNALLYTSIPSSSALSGINRRFAAMRAWPLRKTVAVLGTSAALIAAAVLVKLPHRVDVAVEILPAFRAFYAQGVGVVKDVLVSEGQLVAAGEVLLELDTGDLEREAEQKRVALAKAENEMLKLRSEGNTAEAEIKEGDRSALALELELLAEKLKRSRIVADRPGLVLSSDLGELIGKPVEFGQEIIKLGEVGKAHVRFEVPEAEVPFVRPGQSVRFKVYGFPRETFGEGLKIVSVTAEAKALNPKDAASKAFYALAEVLDPAAAAKLRAGMTGRGRILGEPEPIWLWGLRKPLTFLAMEIFF